MKLPMNNVLASTIGQVLGLPLSPTHASMGGGQSLESAIRSALFSNGEQGAWYDPSDFTRNMWELGPELVTNGTFDTDTTGWLAGNSASLSVVGQKLRIQHDGTNYPLAVYNLSTVAGKTYRVRFSVTRGTSLQGIALRALNLPFGSGGTTLADSGYKTASGDYEFVFTALNSASHIYVIINTTTAGEYDDVDNISVRELTAINPVTLYQDAAGTTPVTAVAQPVGVVLDKRLPATSTAPLDALAFVPAGSTPPTTADTTFLSEACGSVTFPANAGGYTVSRGASATTHPIVIGRRYTHSYRIALSRALTGGETLVVYTTGISGSDSIITLNSGTAGGVWIDFADATVVASATASGSNSCYVYASTAIASPITIYIRQYTAKEIPGNHATQATSAARPMLQQDGNGSYYLAFDGVDDYLRTTFPNLGSNVTIGRSIPGTGASILTGQTIGAGNWDDSTSHCALVIIDRALTGPETTLLTKYLNMRAGL